MTRSTSSPLSRRFLGELGRVSPPEATRRADYNIFIHDTAAITSASRRDTRRAAMDITRQALHRRWPPEYIFARAAQRIAEPHDAGRALAMNTTIESCTFLPPISHGICRRVISIVYFKP